MNNRNRQAAVQARASARTAVGTAHRQWEAACAALIAGGCTNVTNIALGVARQDSDGNPQLLFYHPGVGTRRFERVRGGAFGFGLSRDRVRLLPLSGRELRAG